MSNDPLTDVLKLIEARPHSAQALTLYALVNTLEYERAGCLFKLTKLKDLDEAGRQVAYALMELMVAEGNSGEHWDRLKTRIDELVRAG